MGVVAAKNFDLPTWSPKCSPLCMTQLQTSCATVANPFAANPGDAAAMCYFNLVAAGFEMYYTCMAAVMRFICPEPCVRSYVDTLSQANDFQRQLVGNATLAAQFLEQRRPEWNAGGRSNLTAEELQTSLDEVVVKLKAAG